MSDPRLPAEVSEPRRRALVLRGGWRGHEPELAAESAIATFLGGFEIECSDDLGRLRPDVLGEFDLLVPIWTFGELESEAEQALVTAVERGLGLLAWHGAASAFLTSRPYKHVLGGQFVGHPGGNRVDYEVRLRRDDPLARGLADFSVTSEQYYLLVDPGVSVVASTRILGGERPWLAGVEMPVAWRRTWGEGRVFYCSLGHTRDLLEHTTVAELYRRAARWATRATE